MVKRAQRFWKPRLLVALGLVAPLSAAPAAMVDPNGSDRPIVLDSHLDSSANLARPGWDIMQRHTRAQDLTQLDYPRMVEGGLDGGFWVIFTESGPLTPEGYAKARDFALQRSLAIREMVARNHAHFGIATSAADAERLTREGRKIVFQSIENAYPLGEDLTLLSAFHAFGARMIGPVHGAHNQFADSASDARPKWGGLSSLGRELVREANRLGMILDASHASDAAFDQMLSLSSTPIVLSHSGLKAMSPHPRNIDDDRLRKLGESGGVIQLAAVDFFLSAKDMKAREAEMLRLLEKYGAPELLSPESLADLAYETREMDRRFPPKSNIDDFMRQLFHAVAIAGVDHVGIGVDWDGGGGVPGLDEVSQIPEVMKRLRAAGYSESDIAKIAGGNLLRVLRKVEAQAKASGH